ncbi:MAG: YfhO family protein [Rikenellaceae bacterium]
MISKINWRSKLPFIVAVVLYALLSYGYFAPQIGGDVLYQHDVKQYEGMTQDILESRQESGIDPQWTGSMFGGMPAYLINVAYPAQLIKITFNRLCSAFGTPAAFILFAMLAMWLMLVMMGVNGWVAIVGGLMYGLSTYFFLIIEAGHITKMWALAYAPLMFGAVHMTLRGNMWWGAALSALFASAEIGANHPQITYYFGMAIAAFYLSELYFALKESRIAEFARRTSLLLVAAILAVASNLSPLWYTFEHTPDTMRGGSELVAEGSTSAGLDMEYATAWSYGPTESLNMLVPNFVGGSSFETFAADGAVAKALTPYNLSHIARQLPLYWGPQSFTGGPTYIGAVIIMLALFALLLMKGREKWWIIAISAIMILLAWGRHFMWFSELMFNILPGYNKFRTVSMTLVVVEWTLPLLATMGLAKLWDNSIERGEILKKLKIAVGAISALLLLFIVAGGALLGFGRQEGFELLVNNGFPEDIASLVAGAMAEERFEVMRLDSLRSLLLVIGSGAIIWALATNRLKRGATLSLLGLLVIIDLVPVNRRFLNSDDFISKREAQIYPTAIDKEIMQDKELGYRVLNLTVSPFNDATTSYFHRSVGGYHGAKLSRYQDLIDNYLSSSLSYEVLDMLNTRYIISTDEQGKPILMVNDQASGAAWFVKEVLTVETPRDEIDALGRVNLKEVAVVDSIFGVDAQKNSREEVDNASIELIEYQPNYLRYTYSSPCDQVAIFSEIYYNKGWKAYIDGVEAPYFRANYVLRAMELPAGEHTVEWRFRAPHWSLIEGITLASTLLIILSIVILLIKSIYERGQKIKA